jgi:hypothetical protein
VTVRLLDTQGRPQTRSEQVPTDKRPDLVVSGTAFCPPLGTWHLAREFTMPFWGKQAAYHCYLWMRE